ncbi:MAG: nicotinate-nucleotide diphosphorylase [Thermoguttaceae bacterium]|nr:nicotinate-nucleotide diphosphorylase [Thermoguttaceae bacterium]MDO4858868.1 nicotinate-nucleotide diphosphorylase [Thermoguttaceae bacterium]
MAKDYQAITWCSAVEDDFRTLLDIAIREDVESIGDLTSLSLIPETAVGRAAVVTRDEGIIAGMPTVQIICEAISPGLKWEPLVEDGAKVSKKQRIGILSGPARAMMQAERLILNFVARLSGIATTTNQYVQLIADTKSKVYDTRKTTPGWRLLEKYATCCGGAQNHRAGLYDAILIKDNHLALAAGRAGLGALEYDPALAVRKVRRFLEEQDELGPRPPIHCHGNLIATCKMRTSLLAAVAEVTGSAVLSQIIAKTPCHELEIAHKENQQVPRKPADNFPAKDVIVEVEVDTFQQFEEVLSADPDIIMLDNMSCEMMRRAVELRNQRKPEIELEASGGITLRTIHDVAMTGVERISVGALTHSFQMFDLGLDWLET